MSPEPALEIKSHIAEDTDLSLLGVGLLVELLVLQAAVAQLTVVTSVRLQSLKLSLRLSPSALQLILLGGDRSGVRGFLEWEILGLF